MNQQQAPIAREFSYKYVCVISSQTRKIFWGLVEVSFHLSDVLLVTEGEHYGDVAVEDPNELRYQVQVEREVDHGQYQGT